jgi:hypothetical protein
MTVLPLAGTLKVTSARSADILATQGSPDMNKSNEEDSINGEGKAMGFESYTEG